MDSRRSLPPRMRGAGMTVFLPIWSAFISAHLLIAFMRVINYKKTVIPAKAGIQKNYLIRIATVSRNDGLGSATPWARPAASS